MAPRVTDQQERMRIAAEHRWANPSVTWEQTANAAGISKRQIMRWRQTEEWEIAFRRAGDEYVDKLAPAAVAALLKAWSRGNPSGAIDVLRSYGFLRNERLDVSLKSDEQVTAVIEEVLRLRQGA